MGITLPDKNNRDACRQLDEQTSVMSEFAYNLGWKSACEIFEHNNIHNDRYTVMRGLCHVPFSLYYGNVVQRYPAGCGRPYITPLYRVEFPSEAQKHTNRCLDEQFGIVAEYAYNLGWDRAVSWMKNNNTQLDELSSTVSTYTVSPSSTVFINWNGKGCIPISNGQQGTP